MPADHVDYATKLEKALAETDDARWLAAADARDEERDDVLPKETNMLTTEQLRKIDIPALQRLTVDIAKRAAIEEIRSLDLIHKAARKDLDGGTTLLTEREATELWTDHAVRKYSKLTKASAFARIWQENSLCREHIQLCKLAGWNASDEARKSLAGLSAAPRFEAQPRQVGGTAALAVNEAKTAMQVYEELVAEIRRAHPHLSVLQVRSRAYTDRRHAEALARERAANRVQA